MGDGLAYVDWVDIPVVEAVHVAIWQKTVREERKQHKLWECEELITGQREACAAVNVLVISIPNLEIIRTEAPV